MIRGAFPNLKQGFPIPHEDCLKEKLSAKSKPTKYDRVISFIVHLKQSLKSGGILLIYAISFILEQWFSKWCVT